MTAPAARHAELDAAAREALASVYAFLLELARRRKAEARGVPGDACAELPDSGRKRGARDSGRR